MKAFFVGFFLTLSSISVYASCEKGIHHVFLLHGVGGSKATFGSLEAILNRTDACLRARTFEYRTGSTLSTYDFAKDFHDYLLAEKNKSISHKDKISLIMHSQGGLVASLWLKNFGSKDMDFKRQLDSFITLSTPFWGADFAHVGKILFYPHGGERNVISPFGKKELNEMSFGSATIMDLAENLGETFRQFPNLRPLIIAGMKRFYGPRLLEDDVVVPTYAMNPSRFYVKDTLSFFDKPILVNGESFEKSREEEMIIVPADHLKLTQNGVADVPKNCLTNLKCSHPSLSHVLQHLSGKAVSKTKPYSLTRFRLNLVFNNPELMNYDERDLSLVVGNLSQDVQVPLIERLNPLTGNSNRPKGFAFSFSGILKKDEVQKISVILKYRNQTLRTYEAPVKPGTSTFIDVTLKQEPDGVHSEVAQPLPREAGLRE